MISLFLKSKRFNTMKNILTISLLFISILSYAQVGDRFPDMEAETLKNEFVNIPSDLSDKYTLIGLAYSKKSEQYLKSWFEPVYNQFIYKPTTPSVFDISFDVHCYFIPMFTGAKRPAYQKVMAKLQKTIDRRLQPNVLFYKGQLKEYKEEIVFVEEVLESSVEIDTETNELKFKLTINENQQHPDQPFHAGTVTFK